jgi:hypothetical protein
MTVHIHPESSTSFSAESIAKALGNGKEQRNGNGWQTCCPAHEDKTPSLTVKDITDKYGRPDVSVYCHTGCDYKAVKDKLRARGLLPEWKPPRSTGSVRNNRNNSLPAHIWETSRHDQTAAETIQKAFAFRSIELEPIPPNIRLNNHKGQLSIACAMQSPLDENPPAKPQCVHLTLLDEEGKKKKRSETSPSTKYQGPKTGLVVLLPGKDSSSLVIGEGLETTLSAMQAMGFSGMVCGDAGNMAGMTKMQEQFQEIFILVDSDTSHAGQNAALKAAESIGKANPQAAVWLVAPDDSCFTDSPVELDFNDLLKQDTSGGSIRARFERKKRLDEIDWRPKAKEQPDETAEPEDDRWFLVEEGEKGKLKLAAPSRAAQVVSKMIAGKFAVDADTKHWHQYTGEQWKECKGEFKETLVSILEKGTFRHSCNAAAAMGSPAVRDACIYDR